MGWIRHPQNTVKGASSSLTFLWLLSWSRSANWINLQMSQKTEETCKWMWNWLDSISLHSGLVNLKILENVLECRVFLQERYSLLAFEKSYTHTDLRLLFVLLYFKFLVILLGAIYGHCRVWHEWLHFGISPAETDGWMSRPALVSLLCPQPCFRARSMPRDTQVLGSFIQMQARWVKGAETGFHSCIWSPGDLQ